MNKTTKELNDILLNTKTEYAKDYLNKESNDLINVDFYQYFKRILKAKKITQQSLFINANINEKYGYKILSGEKHTVNRDLIIRLCYVGNFDVSEINRALILYGLAPLYPRSQRDALIMVYSNNEKRDIYKLNEFLLNNRFEPLFIDQD